MHPLYNALPHACITFYRLINLFKTHSYDIHDSTGIGMTHIGFGYSLRTAYSTRIKMLHLTITATMPYLSAIASLVTRYMTLDWVLITSH